MIPSAKFLAPLAVSAAVFAPSVFAEAKPRPLQPRLASASSIEAKYTPLRALDGIVTAESRWNSERSTAPSWIVLELGGEYTLAGLHVFNGLDAATALRSFVVQFWRNGTWHDIPSANVVDNRSPELALKFDDTVVVRTTRLRLWITATYDGYARIREIVVWPAEVGNIPPIAVTPDPVPLIYLNQSGFNLGKSKRFTAPTLPDGTRFEVRAAQGGEVLFTGKITGHIGDFSSFDPEDGREYVVVAGPHTSVPFRVGMWWFERVTYQNAVNFMVDSRHYVGNTRAICVGSFGWRDDHHFGWELHTLVPQFLSNPSAYIRMPRQIGYERPTDPKLWGALEPYREEAPDIVKLIHWGADVIVTQRLTHEHLKAQLAYFLYAWPWLKRYLPEQNRTAVLDYVLATWTTATCDHSYPYDESPEHDLLALKTKLGTTKGAHPPGFSIEPNLLLYAVARRDGLDDPERYFRAAHRQAEWLIANLDWNDPQTTKGQRMSEFITLTGLTHFLREYPERAPAGLADKIDAWTQVAVRRSANLWDFRKLDDGDRWTPTGPHRTTWNEPGNVVGLPGVLAAAQPFVRDAAARARLEQLIYAHLDNFFGRNPTGRHFSYDAAREIEGVEYGWYGYHIGGIGRLDDARFVIDGSPKNEHYPYHPEMGDIGWTEGWVQFNVALNNSLAYLAFAETSLAVRIDGGELLVRLKAPLNFDYTRVEFGEVVVTSGNGDEETVVVIEESPNSRFLTGRIRLDRTTAAKPGDRALQFAADAAIDAAYGFGYLSRHARLAPPASAGAR